MAHAGYNAGIDGMEESPVSAQPNPSSSFGALLRHWRAARHVSQLELASEADISTRHLSFLETGRARPSRVMVRRLAETLALPFRERNDLLTAAGFAPIHEERNLHEPVMARFRSAIQWMLDKQEPYPALVMDRHWNFVELNRGARALVQAFLPPAALERYPNAMELLFAGDGLRPWVENWDEVASILLARIHREHIQLPTDQHLAALYEQLASAEAVPHDWRGIAACADPGPVLPLVLEKDGFRSSMFTTITTFGTPHDVTLQELRIESYFPADAETEQLLETLVDGESTGPAAPSGRDAAPG